MPYTSVDPSSQFATFYENLTLKFSGEVVRAVKKGVPKGRSIFLGEPTVVLVGPDKHLSASVSLKETKGFHRLPKTRIVSLENWISKEDVLRFSGKRFRVEVQTFTDGTLSVKVHLSTELPLEKDISLEGLLRRIRKHSDAEGNLDQVAQASLLLVKNTLAKRKKQYQEEMSRIDTTLAHVERLLEGKKKGEQ